jgi:hypothetical protein
MFVCKTTSQLIERVFAQDQQFISGTPLTHTILAAMISNFRIFDLLCKAPQVDLQVVDILFANATKRESIALLMSSLGKIIPAEIYYRHLDELLQTRLSRESVRLVAQGLYERLLRSSGWKGNTSECAPPDLVRQLCGSDALDDRIAGYQLLRYARLDYETKIMVLASGGRNRNSSVEDASVIVSELDKYSLLDECPLPVIIGTPAAILLSSSLAKLASAIADEYVVEKCKVWSKRLLGI